MTLADADLSVTDWGVGSFLAYNNPSKIFLQRVTWNVGTGRQMGTGSAAGDYIDRFVIANSTITNSINHLWPYSTGIDGTDCSPYGISGGPPIAFNNLTNFWFKNNTVYGYSGEFYLYNGNNIIEENNTFTRDASDKITVTAQNQHCLDQAGMGLTVGQSAQRNLSHATVLDYTANVVAQNNTYNVVNGPLIYNMNDGETIMEERTYPVSLQDTGTVASSTSNTVTVNAQTWLIPTLQPYEPSRQVVIVNGTGWGQVRNVTNWDSGTNTFTVDRAWDINPASGDVISVLVPGFQNGIFRGNVMSGQPLGFVLWESGNANVSIVNNQLTNNGGIILQVVQNAHNPAGGATLGYFNGIEINGNTVQNTLGQFPAYIAVDDAIVTPATIQGTGGANVDIRNNSVIGYSGSTPKYIHNDGSYYFDTEINATIGGYTAPSGFVPSLIGAVFQGNNCTNCSSNYNISGGIYDLTIWNSYTNGVKATPTTTDTSLGGVKSVNTTTGHD